MLRGGCAPERRAHSAERFLARNAERGENRVWFFAVDMTGRTGGCEHVRTCLEHPAARQAGKQHVETGRSFAVVEGGKWVGSARAAFDGIVVAHNELLVRKPELMNSDAYGDGWMLTVRAAHENWRDGLVTGSALAPALEAWFVSEAYRDRSS
jgi:hypothetical protein